MNDENENEDGVKEVIAKAVDAYDDVDVRCTCTSDSVDPDCPWTKDDVIARLRVEAFLAVLARHGYRLVRPTEGDLETELALERAGRELAEARLDSEMNKRIEAERRLADLNRRAVMLAGRRGD